MKLSEAQKVATTILQQMGGKQRLIAMIGAKDIYCGTEAETKYHYLAFRHMSGGEVGQRINYTKIALNHVEDLYELELGDIRGSELTIRKIYDMLEFDQLPRIWQEETGLALSLGTMGR